jgi:hypothetical protein
MRNASVGGRVDALRRTTSAVAQSECPGEDRHGASVEGKSDRTSHISQYRGCGLRCIHGIGDRSTLIRLRRRAECCVQRGPNPGFQLFEPNSTLRAKFRRVMSAVDDFHSLYM